MIIPSNGFTIRTKELKFYSDGKVKTFLKTLITHRFQCFKFFSFVMFSMTMLLLLLLPLLLSISVRIIRPFVVSNRFKISYLSQ